MLNLDNTILIRAAAGEGPVLTGPLVGVKLVIVGGEVTVLAPRDDNTGSTRLTPFHSQGDLDEGEMEGRDVLAGGPPVQLLKQPKSLWAPSRGRVRPREESHVV